MLTISIDFSRSGHKLIVDVVIFTTREKYLIVACQPRFTRRRDLENFLLYKFCPSCDKQVTAIQKILNISFCLSSTKIVFLTILTD